VVEVVPKVVEVVLKVVEIARKVVEVVRTVEEVVPKAFGRCALYAVVSEGCAMCATGAGGHAVHTVLYALCILSAVEGELRLLDVLE